MNGHLAAVFGCEGFSLTPDERAFFRDSDPLGFILFARNVENPDQLRRLTGDLRASVGRDAMIMVDQEGGRVQRLRAPHWREFPAMLDAATSAGPDAPRALALMATLIADDLRNVGIDANCAPVADIAGPETHPFLRNRCYGQTPESVAKNARAVADAYLASGILPVMKHLPGHGRATADTHHELPTVNESKATLQAYDFAPFKALADLPMAMTAHIIFSAYDSLPATQSVEMIRVIREEIGFDGLLLTDDLNMQALSGDLAERTRKSMAAGCDIALHCKGDMAEMLAVAHAVGQMGLASMRRAQVALDRRIVAVPVDIAGVEAELGAMRHGT